MIISSFLGQEWEYVSGITSSVYQFWDIKNKFDDAKDLCTGQEGHLLRLETEAEYQNIKKKILSIGKMISLSKKHCYHNHPHLGHHHHHYLAFCIIQ